MISSPPARADPLTAAIIGLAKLRSVRPPNPPLAPMMSPPSPVEKALRSMPALKALSPLPVMITTQHSSSSASSSMVDDMARLTAPLMALRASGRLMVRISTCPLRSRSTSSAMRAPFTDRPGSPRRRRPESPRSLGRANPGAGRFRPAKLCAVPAPPTDAPTPGRDRRQPAAARSLEGKGFAVGVATSGFQIEGGYNGPGQPANNWAAWERTAGRSDRAWRAISGPTPRRRWTGRRPSGAPRSASPSSGPAWSPRRDGSTMPRWTATSRSSRCARRAASSR